MLKKKIDLIAFTLAEVLITLGIIGIVAAITISTVMSKINDFENIQAWKKIYSEISNAYNLAVKDNVSLSYELNSFYGFDVETVNGILSYINTVQKCKTTTLGGRSASMGFTDRDCTASDSWLSLVENYKSLSGKPYNFAATTRFVAQTPSGAVIYIGGDFQPIWGVDVNGFGKGPNTIGKDVFGIAFTKTWMRPIGAIGADFKTSTNYGAQKCSDAYYDVSSDFVYLPRAAGSGCSAKYILDNK